MNEPVAYWVPPDENPNFVSRPPDPGAMQFFKTIGWEALYHSPFNAVQRFSEMTLEKSDYFNVAGRVLDPEEANQKYGLGGQLVFDEPIKEEAAQLMYRRKIDENDRAYLIGSGQTSGFRKAASYPVAMAATLVDPINFASMFVPVVGEARIARMAQQIGGSALRQRLVQGALTGMGGAAMVEPFILLPALQEQANYGLRDSAVNLGFGAALGGLLHAGLGAIGDRMRRLKPKDADAIFEAAMNNVLKDEPVTAPARVAEFADEVDHSNVMAVDLQAEINKRYAGKDPQADPELNPDTYIPTIEAVSYAKQLLGETELRRRANALPSTKIMPHLGLEQAARDVISQVLSGTFDPTPIRLDSELSLSGVPNRDSRGRFLSKNQRLAMLDQKIREEQAAKGENRGQIVNDNTKENTPSFPKDNLGMTGESAKDINSITSETAEIEKALDLNEAERSILSEEIQADIGNTAQREAGVTEAIKCIVRNLI